MKHNLKVISIKKVKNENIICLSFDEAGKRVSNKKLLRIFEGLIEEKEYVDYLDKEYMYKILKIKELNNFKNRCEELNIKIL